MWDGGVGKGVGTTSLLSITRVVQNNEIPLKINSFGHFLINPPIQVVSHQTFHSTHFNSSCFNLRKLLKSVIRSTAVLTKRLPKAKTQDRPITQHPHILAINVVLHRHSLVTFLHGTGISQITSLRSCSFIVAFE